MNPQLIRELLENGTVAPEFHTLRERLYAPSWRDRAHLRIEVEVGCNLLAVPIVPEQQPPLASPTSTSSSTQGLLLFDSFV